MNSFTPRERPVIQAARITEESIERVAAWCDGLIIYSDDQCWVEFYDAADVCRIAFMGDYVAQSEGGFFPMKPDAFTRKYEEVADGAID